VLVNVKKGDQKKIKKDLHRISNAKSQQLAIQAYCAFCQKYRKVYPGAVKSLVSEIDDLLSSYQAKLSKKERQGLGAKDLQRAQMAFWRKIQTTNLI
jgi:transposase-like protein